MNFCRATNCESPRHGFSIYCQSHKQALRRHGSPGQRGVTVHELKPYVALIEARKAKNETSDAWSMLSARWDVVQDHARATLQSYAEGVPGHRAGRIAAHYLTTIGRNVEAWQVVRTSLAMYLLQDQNPSRFESDVAFDFQLVRRVRGLTDSNAGVYWDHETQKKKRVYRDIPPRAIHAMAQSLKTAFGAPGLMLAAKEREDVEKAREERKRMAVAMEGLS